MKKNLLTVVALMALATSSAMAFDAIKMPYAVNNAAEAGPARAGTTTGYNLQFCGSLDNAYLLAAQDNVTYRNYIYITPEIATQLAGNKLTDITFAAALIASNSRPGSVFVSEDLDADPITSTATTINNGYVNSSFKSQKVSLADPYIIKEGVGFYFGFTVENCRYTGTSADYPVPVDANAATMFAGASDLFGSDGQYLGTVEMSELGNNLYLIGKTVGDKKSLENLISASGFSIGNFTLPVLKSLEGNNVVVSVSNLGTNKITSLGYTVAVDGSETITGDLSVSILANRTANVSLPLPALAEGKGAASAAITRVNDKEVSFESGELNYIALAESYERKFVVEEGTGDWCGWCPRGIVGFEVMEANYPDTFIGIAAHSGDKMEVASYNPMWNYIQGFPGSLINRDLHWLGDPNSGELTSAYQEWSTQGGLAEVKVEAETPADGKINVTATTTFALDDAEADYSLAFVVLEDGIQGLQSNYYAGGSYGTMGGWEKKGSKVAWEYKHVARDIFDFYGIDGSIPASVTKGVPVSYSYEVSLANVANVEKTSIVALLLDNASGTVLNADKVEADKYGVNAISGINIDDNAADVEYYNIQGMRMQGDNLPAGVYITRQGNKVSKVIVK